ncbi:hypothetical protein [Demequina oxidasica]|uniref:hypothetical protein n=1 Tax=Demequina oxidasica TaxID=676199 RepID=UPI000AABE0E3|nr:hypothetical protein [Demequina oxidasica]
MKILRTSMLLAATGLLVAGPASMAMAADGTYDGSMSELNGSGASGTAQVKVEGTEVTVNISGTGFTPNAPHAQHLHGDVSGKDFVCPTDADVKELDKDGDGLLNTLEAAPLYGGVLIALTTEGDTTPDSALAVDRFPTADADGNLEYNRTFTVTQDVADQMANLHIVDHGIDLDGSGTYDGDVKSSLSEDLPLEATIPAACGALGDAQTEAMPAGGVETGNAMGDTSTAVIYGSVALASLAAAGGLVLTNRRRAATK